MTASQSRTVAPNGTCARDGQGQQGLTTLACLQAGRYPCLADTAIKVGAHNKADVMFRE